MQLVLVRHGRTAWNASGRLQGQRDTELDAVGRSQADAVADALAPTRPAALACSDLTRARRTAAPLASRCGLTAVPDPRLREVFLGRFEGLTREQARSRYPDAFASWASGADRPYGGGETPGEVATRVVAALEEHIGPLAAGERLVVVSHGLAIRAGAAALLGLDGWREVPHLDNGCWLTLELAGGGWRVVAGPQGPDGPGSGPTAAEAGSARR